MEKYKVKEMCKGTNAPVEIKGGIYGLPQAGILAQERLVKHLAEHGYTPTLNTPILFKQESRPIAFTLVVDDFGIKSAAQEHTVGPQKDNQSI